MKRVPISWINGSLLSAYSSIDRSGPSVLQNLSVEEDVSVAIRQMCKTALYWYSLWRLPSLSFFEAKTVKWEEINATDFIINFKWAIKDESTQEATKKYGRVIRDLKELTEKRYFHNTNYDPKKTNLYLYNLKWPRRFQSQMLPNSKSFKKKNMMVIFAFLQWVCLFVWELSFSSVADDFMGNPPQSFPEKSGQL